MIPVSSSLVRNFRSGAVPDDPNSAHEVKYDAGVAFADLHGAERSHILHSLQESVGRIASYVYMTGQGTTDFALTRYRVCSGPTRPAVAFAGHLISREGRPTTTQLAEAIGEAFQHWMQSGDFQIALRMLRLY
jgi:hypothetical protein